MKLAAVLTLALFAAKVTVAADASAEVWDVVATLAAALSEPNDAAFMKPLSKEFDKHDQVAREVKALLQANVVTSSISPIENEGDNEKRTLEVDWYIEIQPQTPGASVTQRRENITLTLVKTGKRWMITSLSPVAFFAPPS